MIQWAGDCDLLVDREEYFSRIQDSCGEHHVFFDSDRGVYVKITHGLEINSPGFALAVDTDDFRIGASQSFYSVPYLREATPFEYLTRLVLFNRTFGDSMNLEGVIGLPGQEAIVINQPMIFGRDASDEEIASFMGKERFDLADCPSLGRPDAPSQSFFRRSDYVAVFDTHGGNFLVNDEPRVTPIDALIVADQYLVNWLALTPAQRRQEGVERTPRRGSPAF